MNKTSYETRAAQELDRLAAQIDAWNRDITKMKTGARNVADISIEEVRRRYDTARLKLHLLRKDTEKPMEELRGGVEGAMADLRGAVDQARKYFGA